MADFFAMLSGSLASPILRDALFGCAGFALFAWVTSLVTGNASQVDRLWSLLPPVYIGFFAWHGGFEPRLVLMTVLSAAWGARLTFNFARKGGYKPGGEDYRWPYLRTRLSPVLFQLFNFSFIASYQNFLLLLLALPAFVALGGGPLGVVDLIATLGFLLFLLGETVADNQQWRFHEDKRVRLGRGEKIESPFLTTGLFRFSRHPNFFCEQGMWWCIYLFGVGATAQWLNLGLIGPVLLTLLFQGSTQLTEKLTLGKYPAYAAYQKRTSRLLPLPPRG